MPLNEDDVDVELVVTVPVALICAAVTASIISMSETFAPLIKISSLSELISNKLPKLWLPALGTIIKFAISGANSNITKADSSVKKKVSPKFQFSKAKNSFIAEITLLFISASFVTSSLFLTILKVACKSALAFAPNNTLYFTG